jgi:hypothetical protein
MYNGLVYTGEWHIDALHLLMEKQKMSSAEVDLLLERGTIEFGDVNSTGGFVRGELECFIYTRYSHVLDVAP